jgi:serine/threonine-protein kinase
MLQCSLCATRYADGTPACPLDHGPLLTVPPPGEYGPRWTPDSRAFALAVSSRGSVGGLGHGSDAGRGGLPAPEPPEDPLIGQVLGARLRVLRRIGQGGMGTVYVAEHVGLGKQVAVKVLSAQYAEDRQHTQLGPMADLVRRLHIEARHTAALKSEHIVEVFDIGTTAEGRPYVEMELLTGESLAQRLARCSALSELDTLRVGRQLASALATAHDRGIVHRDIKPENIFLCAPEAYGRDPREGDFVKVLDFGISKAVRARASDEAREAPADDPEVRLTRTGAVLGTPLYMSPEQVRGEPLDHRVDVYAVGVVLYECLTGSVPHGAVNYLAVVAKILTEAPEPPSQRSPERSISPALEHIVLRAMAAERERRYPTMQALLEDLRRYAAGEPLLPETAAAPLDRRAATTPGAAGSDSGRVLESLWRPILVGMLLALALAIGVAVVLRPRGTWSTAAAPAPARSEPRPAAPVAQTTAPAPTRQPAPAPAVEASPVEAALPPVVPPPAGAAPLDPHPLHRPPRAHSGPGARATASPPRAADALLLPDEEQAPNPFTPPAPGAASHRPAAGGDDTHADPR